MAAWMRWRTALTDPVLSALCKVPARMAIPPKGEPAVSGRRVVSLSDPPTCWDQRPPRRGYRLG